MTRSASTWLHLARQSVSAWIDDDAASMGAAISYYTALSMAPLLLIVIAVAGLLYGEAAAAGALTAEFEKVLGAEGARLVKTLLAASEQSSGNLPSLVIGGLTLLLGATTVFAEIQGDLDRIWRVKAPVQSGVWRFLRTRLLSFGLVLVVGFLLLISLVASSVIAALGEFWGTWLAGQAAFAAALNDGVSLAIITVLFALIFKTLPSTRIAWSDVWVGALVTALLFTVGKSAIGLYLGTVAVASPFGAAGTFVVLMVWVYYAAQIFLLGAEFTHQYALAHGSHRQVAMPEAAKRAVAASVDQGR